MEFDVGGGLGDDGGFDAGAGTDAGGGFDAGQAAEDARIEAEEEMLNADRAAEDARLERERAAEELAAEREREAETQRLQNEQDTLRRQEEREAQQAAQLNELAASTTERPAPPIVEPPEQAVEAIPGAEQPGPMAVVDQQSIDALVEQVDQEVLADDEAFMVAESSHLTSSEPLSAVGASEPTTRQSVLDQPLEADAVEQPDGDFSEPGAELEQYAADTVENPLEVDHEQGSLASHLKTLADQLSDQDPQTADALQSFQMGFDQALVANGGAPTNGMHNAIAGLSIWAHENGVRWGVSGESILLEPSKLFEPALAALDPTEDTYADVIASQYKCNIYVAEALFRGNGVIHHAYPEGQPGKWAGLDAPKWFPYRAVDWGDFELDIPHFELVEVPEIGDVVAFSGMADMPASHVGIYLGTYGDQILYLSARAVSMDTQPEGIQIKLQRADAVKAFRRYMP